MRRFEVDLKSKRAEVKGQGGVIRKVEPGVTKGPGECRSGPARIYGEGVVIGPGGRRKFTLEGEVSHSATYI